MRYVGRVAANRASAERNRKVVMVLIGIMLFLIAVSIVTILVKR